MRDSFWRLPADKSADRGEPRGSAGPSVPPPNVPDLINQEEDAAARTGTVPERAEIDFIKHSPLMDEPEPIADDSSQEGPDDDGWVTLG
jgi:hypothetical protein